jgi:hypothetical protein
MSQKPTPELARLKALLENQESFPLEYMHKFIGRNSPRFIQGLEAFDARFPKLERRGTRLSAGDAHVAVTYVFMADSADEILEVLEATQLIEDVLVIL